MRVLHLIWVVFVATCWFIPTAAGGFVSANSADWLSGWEKRIKLAIDYDRIEENLFDFPLLVHLSPSSGRNSDDASGIFDELESDSDRKKIAFTTSDGKTQCYAEIEDWSNAKREAWIWVKVPEISSGENTFLYFYYDRQADDNSSFVGDTGSKIAQNVWDTNFVMVQHLDENGHGIEGEYIDSTFRHNNGTGGRGKPEQTPSRTDSKIGQGQLFDGLDDYIEVPDCDQFSATTTGGLTISFWMSPRVENFSTPDNNIRFLGKGDPKQYEWSFVMYNQDGTDRPQRISFYIFNLNGGLGAGHYTQEPVAVNEWVYITGKIDGNYIYIYKNGEYINKSNYTMAMGTIPKIVPENGNAPLRIGTRNLEDHDWWNGRVDELRISGVPRSSAWIKASYYSENDSLVDFDIAKIQAPVLNPVGNKSVNAGEILSFTLSAVDPDGDTLTYASSNLPPGAILDHATGTFFWKPGFEQTGTYSGISFTVSDGMLTDYEKIDIIVNQPSRNPTSEKAEPRSSRLVIPLVVGIGIVIIVAITLLVHFLHQKRPK
jgi:hypothetical protein